MLLLAVIFESKRKKAYLQDLATLEGLRRLHGSDISFEEENVATNAGEKLGAVKARDPWRGFEPLFAFSLIIAVLVILPMILQHFLSVFSK